ncbi:MAG: ferredoxin--NADP reductase, partial [Legionella sp.]
MQVISFPVTLVESFMISPKVKHFVFNCEQSPTFNYLPGQFITVHFEHGEKSLKRSYSIANESNQENRIEFAAGFVDSGPGTEYLFNLKPGEKINISGPFGRLIFKEEIPSRYILVATSTGITP